jgi:hypothetical protein
MNIPNALLYLFPDADPLADYEIQDDGNGPYISAWHLPGPQPTPEQLQAASDAVDALAAQAAQEAAALRTKVRTTAQSAVGVSIDQLTNNQVRALLAVLLWREGALDKDGKVRPFAEWAEK